MRYVILWMLVMFAITATAGEGVKLDCTPKALSGVPGTPLSVQLTIEDDHAAPARVLIPAVSNLVLRTVERIPIRRTEAGRFVQERTLIWQGLEAGHSCVTNLTAELDGKMHAFPALDITIDPVTAAEPPAKEASE
jgi:hypothetical protein